jgi:hypothetical protein
MKFSRFTLPLILLMMLGTIKATAAPVVTPKAYMFGFVANFTDSVVYFTDIQTVDSVWYDSKTKFLLGRSGYSNQLRDYFSHNMKKPHTTCVVIFALNRKDAEKYIDKLVDSTDNSANEKISRIGKAFRDLLAGTHDSVNTYIPIGEKGEYYRVSLDRSRVCR